MTRTEATVAAAIAVLVISACDGDEPLPECSTETATGCTWAGVQGERGLNGEGLDRRETFLGLPADLTFAPDGTAWISDWNNHIVRRVELDDRITTVIGARYEGDGPPGETDRLPLCNPEGAPALTVALNHPTDVEFAPDGTVVVAAWHNNKIRVLDPATGIIKVLAGDSYGYAGDGVAACNAVFNQPKSLAIDPDGRIYLIDQRNQRIRMIDVDPDRTITTVAGMGMAGDAGDGGPALGAMMHFDAGVTPVPSGSLALRDGILYLADSLNNRIRSIDLATGTINAVAGTGTAGYSGDGGSALEATFNQPLDIELGPDDRLYVADTMNHVVRAIDLAAGTVETVVGTGEDCPGAFYCYEAEEGLPAREVRLNTPYGIAFDAEGNLYIADTYNSRIVRIAR